MSEKWINASGGENPMLVIHNGRACFMVYNGRKWVYIPERRWVKMTDAERARYHA